MSISKLLPFALYLLFIMFVEEYIYWRLATPNWQQHVRIGPITLHVSICTYPSFSITIGLREISLRDVNDAEYATRRYTKKVRSFLPLSLICLPKFVNVVCVVVVKSATRGKAKAKSTFRSSKPIDTTRRLPCCCCKKGWTSAAPSEEIRNAHSVVLASEPWREKSRTPVLTICSRLISGDLRTVLIARETW